MNWYIEDYNQTLIYITNLWSEYYIPKFRISMQVDEPSLTLAWNDRERGEGGDQREIVIDYEDVVDGYSGYLDNPSSAQDLMDQIETMILSGFAGSGGDILTAKADLLSHDGVSDTILPGGSNGFILQRNDSETTGLEWVDPSSLPIAQIEEYHVGSYQSLNPVDATTYYLGGSGYVMQPTITGKNIYPKQDCTLIAAHIMWGATSTAGSNESFSIYVRVNDTTDYLINTVGDTNFVKVFSNLSMNGGSGIALTTSDFYMIKVVCPTWATNPTAVGCQGTIFYQL